MLFLFLQEKMYRNNILCRIDNPTVGKIDITPDEQLKPISASTVIAHLLKYNSYTINSPISTVHFSGFQYVHKAV